MHIDEIEDDDEIYCDYHKEQVQMEKLIVAVDYQMNREDVIERAERVVNRHNCGHF